MAGIALPTDCYCVNVGLTDWDDRLGLRTSISCLVLRADLIEIHAILASDPRTVDSQAITSYTSTVKATTVRDLFEINGAVIVRNYYQVVEHSCIPICTDLIHESSWVCGVRNGIRSPYLAVNAREEHHNTLHE